MSKFSLDAYEDHFKDSTASIVELARLAEATERYENMCAIMKELVKRSISESRELSVEERNLLSVAYKNVIGTRRASWRTLNVEREGKSGTEKDLIEKYKAHVETELKQTCEEVIDIVKQLVDASPKGSSDDPKVAESAVFYLKMAGDYYRYLAESVGGDDSGKQAAEYYCKAYDQAKSALSATHPIRLGLALNYSVCYYEILKEPKEACTLAKTAFDDAISKLDTLEEADYKDSTLIMQLLRDNLTLWTSDQSENVAVEDISDEN